MGYIPKEHTPLAIFAMCVSCVSVLQMMSYGLPNSNMLAGLVAMFAAAVGSVAFFEHVRYA